MVIPYTYTCMVYTIRVWYKYAYGTEQRDDYQFDAKFDLGIGEGNNAIASDHGTLGAEGNSSGVENKENAMLV